MKPEQGHYQIPVGRSLKCCSCTVDCALRESWEEQEATE